MADRVLTAASERHRELLEELLAEVAEYNPDVDRDLLERAFVFASEAHEGQQRRSGEDFILHPLGVDQEPSTIGRPASWLGGQPTLDAKGAGETEVPHVAGRKRHSARATSA